MHIKKNRIIVVWIIFIFITLSFYPVNGENISNNGIDIISKNLYENEDVEYYALLIGLEYNFEGYTGWTSEMAYDAINLYNTLTVSDNWKEENIRLLLDANATKINIIRGLTWLKNVADKNDVVLIFFSGHGDQLVVNFNNFGIKIPIDLPPFDEKDRCDEFLVTWQGVLNPFSNIRDDLFSRYLSKMRSDNIAVIVDSCFSGGMVDTKLVNKNLVFVSCCEENETAGATPSYSSWICEALQGNSDYDNNDKCSLEEAFVYAYTKYSEWPQSDNPKIIDLYPGELYLTNKNIPPAKPEIRGEVFNKVDVPCNFSAKSFDSENHSIKFGWDWDYMRYWSESEDEWTNETQSEKWENISKIWYESGIYDIRVKAKDVKGAELLKFQKPWSKIFSTIVCTEDEMVDQFLINGSNFYLWNDEDLSAQSFTASLNTLSKVRLKLWFIPNGDSYNFTVYIRENLTGENLTKKSIEITTENKTDFYYFSEQKWIEFAFSQNLTLKENTKYYIVLKYLNECKHSSGQSSVGWVYKNKDFYQNGESYFYWPRGGNESEGWKLHSEHLGNLDYCFATYG